VLARLQHEAPPSPHRVRRDVSRDLETICQRCLEKEPADRYSSAAELADDLDRFLAGKPILARPIGVTERAWKWSKRHPALAVTAWLLITAIGFLSGTALQLHGTQAERDRALVAEDRAIMAEFEKTELLADSYAKAGALAMQRGQFSEAVLLFDQSIASGHPNPVALRLNKINAHYVLREFNKCEMLLGEVDGLSLNRQQRGERLMWEAELSTRSTSSPPAPEDFYRRALADELSKADRIYVEGMLTESSPEAVRRFEQSLVADPFHHRARMMLVNLLVTLGRLDAAQFQTQVGQQLFPEDPYFRLMEGFVLAVRGESEDAIALLDTVLLSDDDKDAWLRTYELMNKLVTLTTATKSLTLAVGSQIVQSLLSERESLATVVDYGLRFPRPLSQRLVTLSGLLDTFESQEKHPATTVIAELADQHPEGTLLIWLGEFQIADDDLVAARDTFRKAVETPSLLRNHRTVARLGVLATSSALAFVRKQDHELNLKYAVEAVRGIDPQEEYRGTQCKLFMQMALAAHDETLCRLWLGKWAAQVGNEDSLVLWHGIELEFMAERYMKALEACDQVLRDAPDDEHALRMRQVAVDAMRKVISD
jgi:tetratricopeptide (TPR) repeat protein